MLRNVASVTAIALLVGLTAIGTADAKKSKTFGCKSDRARLCAEAPGKALSCLKQHLDELTPACRAKILRKK